MQNIKIQTPAYAQQKWLMWHKVQELKKKHLKNVQIASELKINRDTVSSYLKMSEVDFLTSGSFKRKYYHKLSDYEAEVYDLLEKRPYLTAAQVEDILRERHPALKVCTKTFYNYVEIVRSKYDIPKESTNEPRAYEKVPCCLPGEYAQVDFGERYMQLPEQGKKKVYFFVMVLCYSRYKFVYMSDVPFNAELAVYAHELAFAYFGGIPQNIIYDQDKVFIHKENFGDYLLTNTFRSFVDELHFTTIFCRKSDPESKGKVENVVKYVKYNFITSRTYTNITSLNESVLSWLERTANGTVHRGICKIPGEVFSKEEKMALRPYQGVPKAPKVKMKTYQVRKDNTIHYHSSYYSLPVGTYKGPFSEVYAEDNEVEITIYSCETGKTICKHALAKEAGSYVKDPAHTRITTVKKDEIMTEILTKLGNQLVVQEYLQALEKDRPRYYLPCLNAICSSMYKVGARAMVDAITECHASCIYNPNDLIAFADMYQKRYGYSPEDLCLEPAKLDKTYTGMVPEKTSIESFNSYL